MKSLIIGKGQIGEALYEIIKPHFDVEIRDIEPIKVSGVDVLHICFPDSVNFVDYVNEYRDMYTPALTIIHSSIGVGKTEEMMFPGCVYSPVRGRHPKLKTEMLMFTKFVGGAVENDVERACAYLKECGFEVEASKSSTTLELVKLLSNIHMGLEIAWAQEAKRIVEYFGGDYETYLKWEKTYREGYERTGNSNLIRPIMQPNPIGGHCILECTKILASQYPSLSFDFIKNSNDREIREEKERARNAA